MGDGGDLNHKLRAGWGSGVSWWRCNGKSGADLWLRGR
jgi:hypothetical protein